MEKIYLPYHSLIYNDKPAVNWYPTGQEDYSQLELHLGLDQRLARKTIAELTVRDRWLYELNYFYTDRDFMPGWQILDPFVRNPLLMDGLLQARGFLLINLSLEGFIPYPNHRFTDYMQSYGIPADRVIFAGGSHDIKDDMRDAGLPFLPLHVRAFESISCSWQQQQPITIARQVRRRFLCFNRRFRAHRFQLLVMLNKAGLLEDFYLSFARDCEGSNAASIVREQCAELPDSQMIINGIDQLYNSLPMILDTDDQESNLIANHFGSSIDQLYLQTGISVVTETLFHANRVFISEKTYHPMRYAQAFIIVGTAGCLAALKRDGYKTFSDWWDESYDSILDHQQRLSAVVDLIADIAAWSSDRFSRFIDESRDICRHNLAVLNSAHERTNHSPDIGRYFSDL